MVLPLMKLQSRQEVTNWFINGLMQTTDYTVLSFIYLFIFNFEIVANVKFGRFYVKIKISK